jgi:hypothetical protein
LWTGTAAFVSAQQPPPPQPFPRSGSQPPATTTTPAPAAGQPAGAPAAPAQSSGPADATIGGVLYPSSQLLQTFDLGRGQRCLLYGTNASYIEVLTYYKQALKDGGRELFKTPAMQQFDLGKFQDQTMAHPPSIVVKDYGSEGYLFVDGTKQTRFKTVIQIVPMPGR